VTESVLAPAAVVLEGLPLSIDRAEVLRLQGYGAASSAPTAEVLALFEEARGLAEALLAPRVVYRAVAAALEAPDVIRAGDRSLRIPEIARFWGSLAHVGLAVCTIGDALERRATALFEARELPLAVMLDSVGSAATADLAEAANDRLCEMAITQGLKVTSRISPGYAGWDVADQRALFALCPGEPAGVRLNDFCVMTPVKSLSFIVGIGVAVRVDRYFTQCRRCWMRGCGYRRAPAERARPR
jgi:hypothetical protein